MKTIYVDMDGVLADLEKGLFEFNGFIPDEHSRSDLFKKELPAYVEADGFETQSKMTCAVELVDFLIYLKDSFDVKLAILTSCGHFYHPISRVGDQKRKMMEREFPQLNYIPFCTTTSGKEKSFFAHPDAFLIDDYENNINAFKEAGGQGFVYLPETLEDCKVALLEFVS